MPGATPAGETMPRKKKVSEKRIVTPRKKKISKNRIIMLRKNRGLAIGKELNIPDEMTRARAEALIEHSYAEWIEVAVAQRRNVERATAVDTR